MRSIEVVLEMGGGYVLDFSNQTFAEFFADNEFNLDQAYPTGSKAKKLRAFLENEDPWLVAQVLRGLLDRRRPKPDDETSRDLLAVRGLVDRLEQIQGIRMTHLQGVEELNLSYVHEMEAKIDGRLTSKDHDGAITVARTLLEGVLRELERQLSSAPGDYKGDLLKQFKAVTKLLRMDERSDLDENFKQVIRGLVQIVSGLAPIRNRMSDGHARERRPQPHHARVIANASKTVASFLVESYLFQLERGSLTRLPEVAGSSA